MTHPVRVLPFMFLRTDIAILGVTPGSVVVQLDIFKDPGSGLFHRAIVLSIDQFNLQSAEEGLHHRTVSAIPFPVHTAA
jgi:hypothetical protein